MWTAKAIGELKKGVLHNIAALRKPRNSRAFPAKTNPLFSGRFLLQYLHE